MNYYTILPASLQHLLYLPDIEDAAGEIFPIEDLPEPLRSICLLPEDFENALNNDLLWVVVDESHIPIAFLLAKIIDKSMHIAEFDVHPDHGRRGVGSQLLDYVLAIARQRAFQAVTLTTFEHLPWNAPYYSKHGFEVIEADKIGDELAQIVKKEKLLGMRRRVAMKIKL